MIDYYIEPSSNFCLYCPTWKN